MYSQRSVRHEGLGRNPILLFGYLHFVWPQNKLHSPPPKLVLQCIVHCRYDRLDTKGLGVGLGAQNCLDNRLSADRIGPYASFCDRPECVGKPHLIGCPVLGEVRADKSNRGSTTLHTASSCWIYQGHESIEWIRPLQFVRGSNVEEHNT